MSRPETNRIVIAQMPGGPDKLRIVERPIPEPGPGQVRIRNVACGVNRPDQFERMGFYPPPPGAPEGLGLEVSGHIDAVGTSVTALAVGDPVCALVSGGGYADFSIAHERAVLPRPHGIDLIDCAGLPETLFTVWANLFEDGRLSHGDTCLIHGGTSGIGTTAIQMAKAAGATVITTSGSDEKTALCRQLGADIALNYKNQDFVDAVRTHGGADIILDMVGGDYVQRNIKAAKPGGRILSIAFLKGSRVEIDLMPVMLKRLVLTGSTLRSRPDEEKARIAAAIRDQAWTWVEHGQVSPVIDSRFPLEDVVRAHERLDSGTHAGKILLLN